ncbi:MAG: diguanylate cyclase domain-containing protein [Alphaproteobacteria bacterium]
MSLENQNDNRHWDMLLPVLEEHAEWFHEITQCLFYAEDDSVFVSLKKPTSFAQWMVFANKEGGVQPEGIEKLASLHADLFKAADVLVHHTQETRVKPSYKDFKGFLTIYEEFLICVRRMEKDLHLEGSGYDSFTGLRSSRLMASDVKRELHRLARQGKNFCIAMARIDNFDVIKEAASDEELGGYIKLIAGLIKLSIRSYDDGYYMGDDEFVLCVKQAEVSGGISALERLRRELEQQKIEFVLKDGSKVPLSMSCCIAEPVESDDVVDLITNLRNDLNDLDKEKTDTVLEFMELSPLQRFVQDGGNA